MDGLIVLGSAPQVAVRTTQGDQQLEPKWLEPKWLEPNGYGYDDDDDDDDDDDV